MDEKISVIIPIHKVEPYLRQCLDSVVNQTYEKLEIILIDDGSPDKCGAICDEYAARDERVRAMHKRNGGVHAAWNDGQGGTRDTLEVALTLKLDTAQFYPLMPFPGTEAYEWAVAQGYLSGKYTDYLQEDGSHNTTFHLGDITAEELVEYCNYCRCRFYLRPWYIGHRLWKGLKDPNDLKRALKSFGRFKEFLWR